MPNTAPKVFLSHASEDKARFVIEFATKLRAQGIDVWLDRWEMLPGDSLVNKIFEEGLKNAQAVIVVLSSFSVSKPWVREELNVSVVKRINEGSKIIPVVLDDCEVPTSLSATVWERIKDINSYESELNRVVMSIHGHSEKPALGKPPRYVSNFLDQISGLTKLDTLIFKSACELAMERGFGHANSTEVFDRLASFEVPESEYFESLDILDRKSYIKANRVMGGNIPIFTITSYGFEKFISQYIPDYDQTLSAIAYQLVNEGVQDTQSLATNLNKSLMLITHIIEKMSNRGLLSFAKVMGGGGFIHNISPELKRSLR